MSQKYVPNNYTGGTPTWRLFLMHYVAMALGIIIKVDGFPLGASRNYDRSKAVANEENT